MNAIPAPARSRPDGRAADELRPVSFQRDFTELAAGSVLVSFGRTRVLCTASVDDDVPRWLRGGRKGWVTAEYSMLPGSSPERVDREAAKGRQSGRTQEIQRLIGRSLRAVTDLTALPELQVIVDCDVLQADGGTRTAAICGGYVALHDAFTRLVAGGRLARQPLLDECAAVSVGVVDGVPVLDLPYVEDSRAETDMNVVMTGNGGFVEVQGTAEGSPFSRAELDALLDLAAKGTSELVALRARRAGRPSGAEVTAAGSPGPEGRGVRIVLATANRGKAAEIADLLAPVPALELSPRPVGLPEPAEDGATLLDNARIKARAVVAATGRAAVADDTGLEVRALDGAPGVVTARYAGPDATYADNVAKLLRELGDEGDRSATWRTVALVAWPDGSETWAEGTCTGVVTHEPRGAGGFGYDPVFVPGEGDGRTFAELSRPEKNALSHRGRAFRALAALLVARQASR